MDAKEILKAEERELVLDRTRIAALYLATPMVLSFTDIDHFFMASKQLEFFFVRLGVVPVSILIYFLLKSQKIRDSYHEAPALLLGLFLGVYHAYLVTQSGYENSGYYAGISLAAYLATGFFTWRVGALPLVALVTYAPYYVAMAFAPHDLELNVLVTNSAFMLSSGFLGTASFFIKRELHRREIQARTTLEQQNQEQARIIQRKTQEGIYLEKLANQFSPQIVEAIKNGDLDLEKRSRRIITCVFLDIENSTRRSNRIDYVLYTNLIGEFFSECIEIFLKHDVTVGTYLGDGMLAFANAPGYDPNHQMKVIAACLEILQKHRRKANYYREQWRTDFNIRIGVETGYAMVGFFPSRAKGVYTALGETVNLASRLCARSRPNEICVTKAFLKDLGPVLENAQVQHLAPVTDIKGFEGDLFDLYSIDLKEAAEVASKEGQQCGLCSQSMTIESDLGDCLYMVCSSCGYKDIVDKTKVGLNSVA